MMFNFQVKHNATYW